MPTAASLHAPPASASSIRPSWKRSGTCSRRPATEPAEAPAQPDPCQRGHRRPRADWWASFGRICMAAWYPWIVLLHLACAIVFVGAVTFEVLELGRASCRERVCGYV